MDNKQWTKEGVDDHPVDLKDKSLAEVRQSIAFFL
jgi:hypothetical protein